MCYYLNVHFQGQRVNQLVFVIEVAYVYCEVGYEFITTEWCRRKSKYFWRRKYWSLWEITVHMNTCLNGEWLPRYSCLNLQTYVMLDFCLCGWTKSEVYKRIGGYTRPIARSDFGCCCQHKETWISEQNNNTRSSHTSWKVQWGVTVGFWKFIVKCDRYHLIIKLK